MTLTTLRNADALAVRYDIAIVGAGPAGMAAASECARLGLAVVVFDENAEAGGQIYRAIERNTRTKRPYLGIDYAHGAALWEAFSTATATYVPSAMVWSLEQQEEGGEAMAELRVSVAGRSRIVFARRVILATGTFERPIAFANDDRPGVMLAGAVRTVRHSRDGRRQIGAFYYAGDLFGLTANDEHDYTAEALCPTRIVSFERSSTGGDGATVAAALCELSRVHGHLAMLGRRSAEEKVASFLVDMARRGASDRTRLPMSRQDMADYLGLALETVSRVLSRFKDEGLVSFTSSRHFQIVRGAALNRLAET